MPPPGSLQGQNRTFLVSTFDLLNWIYDLDFIQLNTLKYSNIVLLHVCNILYLVLMPPHGV